MTNLQKIIRNIGSGLIYQILTLALGITIPRLVLVNLGSEANGLLNSVNQALVYLVLLEGGVGLTITQALYKPVADREHSDINGIMSAANAFYRHVGTMYFIGMSIRCFHGRGAQRTSAGDKFLFPGKVPYAHLGQRKRIYPY